MFLIKYKIINSLYFSFLLLILIFIKFSTTIVFADNYTVKNIKIKEQYYINFNKDEVINKPKDNSQDKPKDNSQDKPKDNLQDKTKDTSENKHKDTS